MHDIHNTLIRRSMFACASSRVRNRAILHICVIPFHLESQFYTILLLQENSTGISIQRTSPIPNKKLHL